MKTSKWVVLFGVCAGILMTGCSTTQKAMTVDEEYTVFLERPDTAPLEKSGDAQFDALILVLNNIYQTVSQEVSEYTPAVKGNADYVNYLVMVEKEVAAGKEIPAAASSVLARSKANAAMLANIKAGNQAVMKLNPTRRLVDLGTLSKDVATVTPKLVPLASSVFKPSLSVFSKYYTLKDMKARLAYVGNGTMFLTDQYRIALETSKQL